MRRVIPVSVVAVVLVVFAALALTVHRTPSPPINAVRVSIIPGASSYATGYDPDNITVVIGVNNTVVWTNNDDIPHTVTAVDGSFNSGNMNPGATFTYTFTTPGTYEYYCIVHPWMHGYVTVIEPG